MSQVRVIEDSPTELVIEKSRTTKDIWRGGSKYFINPLVILAVLYTGLYIRSLNKLPSPAWLYWVIGMGVVIVEIFSLYAVLYAEKKITITIDLRSGVASRTIIFVSGKRQMSETALGNVRRIVLHQYNEIREPRLELNAADQSNFIIAMYSDLQSDLSHDEATNDVPIINSLESLGKKMGERLQKPVVKKTTEVDVNETLISEEVIQP